MKRFIEGEDRSQITLFPERLEDYVGGDKPVRVVDAFVDQLDLFDLGFKRIDPSVTGRPGYHPSVLLKLHVYGYLNRVQSSRRLEREATRNVEVMWLCGRLVPDHKTIAEFRKVNDRGSGMVGYNVQSAVDTEYHLIVTHEVTNVGTDKSLLSHMSKRTKAALKTDTLDVVADRGYYKSKEILACHKAGIIVTLPKPQTSSKKAKGLFVKPDFVYLADQDVYICPAGEHLIYRFTREERGLTLHRYWSSFCQDCAIKEKCTPAKQRRITRWEHEEVLDAVQQRLDEHPEKMHQRRETVEHPFGTLKCWMGYTHFQMKTLKHVGTEMALHVLAYNLKRVMKIIGIAPLIAAMQAV